MLVRLRRLLLVASLLPLLPLVAACSDSPTSPTAVVSLEKTDLRFGTGVEAASGHTVSMHYTLWLYDGSKADHKGLQIETSIGGTPFDFVLGAGEVIPGWDTGIVGMRAGGQRRLIVPASLAYGDTRRSAIPPNTPLVFDLELLAVS